VWRQSSQGCTAAAADEAVDAKAATETQARREEPTKAMQLYEWRQYNSMNRTNNAVWMKNTLMKKKESSQTYHEGKNASRR